jgi:hypothetical protein
MTIIKSGHLGKIQFLNFYKKILGQVSPGRLRPKAASEGGTFMFYLCPAHWSLPMGKDRTKARVKDKTFRRTFVINFALA